VLRMSLLFSILKQKAPIPRKEPGRTHTQNFLLGFVAVLVFVEIQQSTFSYYFSIFSPENLKFDNFSEIRCRHPGQIRHGHPSVDVTSSPTWAVRDTLQYVCDEFYEISGENPITCLSSGVWSKDVPKCIGKPSSFKIFFSLKVKLILVMFCTQKVVKFLHN